MTNENMFDINYDIVKDFVEGKTENIVRYILEYTKKLKTLLRQNKYDDLKEQLDSQKTKLLYVIRKEERTKDISYLIGKYIGIIESMDEYLLENLKKEKAFKVNVESKIEDIPHINDIMIHIAGCPGIRHGKLAEKVNIEKNTLTPYMDKLIKFGLVSFSRPGKFKYYYLTSAGVKYHDEYCNEINPNTDVDYLIEQLLIAISKENNPSEIVGKVMQAVYAGKHKAEGYRTSIEEQFDPVRLIPQIAKLKSFDIKLPYATNELRVDDATVLSLWGTQIDKVIIGTNNNDLAIESLLLKEV